MTNLTHRPETAAEGSRELDLEIWDALYGGPDLFQYVLSDDGECVVWKNYIPGVGVSAEGCDYLPPFTTSIDAAMTTIPDGWLLLSITKRYTKELGYHYEVVLLDSGDEHAAVHSVAGRGADIPLAICAASLKAREAGDE